MNKQIIINILFNVLNFCVNVILGIALTPYLIKHMGIMAYGMIPLAMFITSYVGVLTQSLTASVNKYLIGALQRKDNDEANVIFNTALVLMLILIGFASIVFTWPILHIDIFISIPSELISETINLFFCVLFGFFISLISSVFSVSMYSNNRIDLMQLANIIKNIVKLISILTFFYYGRNQLSSIGYSIIISEFVALLIYIIMTQKLTPDISLRLGLFDLAIVKKLSGLGGWLIVDQVGVILLSKLDLLVVNKTFGSSYGGKYSIITQFSDLLRAMASLIGGVLGPVMMILHSKNDYIQMATLTKIFMKAMSLTMAIPVIVLCVFSKEIIELWVGPKYNDIAYLMWFIVFPLIINLGAMPLFSINIAMNKVKIPSISNVVFGIFGLCTSLYLVNTVNLGIAGVAIGFILATTLKNSFFTPLYAAYIMQLPKMTFLVVHIKTLLFTLLFTVFLFVIKNYVEVTGMYLLFILMLLCIVGFIFTFAFYTPKEIAGAIGVVKGGFNKNGKK